MINGWICQHFNNPPGFRYCGTCGVLLLPVPPVKAYNNKIEAIKELRDLHRPEATLEKDASTGQYILRMNKPSLKECKDLVEKIMELGVSYANSGKPIK